MVADVRPYELMKLRMLNGSHSMIAYLATWPGINMSATPSPTPSFANSSTTS